METLKLTLFMIGIVNVVFGLTILIAKEKIKSSLMYVGVGIVALAINTYLCGGNVFAEIMMYNQHSVNPWISGSVFFVSFVALVYLDVHKIEKKSSALHK